MVLLIPLFSKLQETAAKIHLCQLHSTPKDEKSFCANLSTHFPYSSEHLLKVNKLEIKSYKKIEDKPWR